ncbi:C1 family peptidase [Labilibaculum sp. DW002]|uniref:C1 family peptidase n=1 Tax=Paralabilibaculum antarcticum TaxID=2912572 RepID=A0ABT5VUI5_9BACT|nr:C1 family peptidase [Labilibaculum sp. DW002]MDE5418467.1 C1 family peptidase [Labilibaculum sp. DW002]
MAIAIPSLNIGIGEFSKDLIKTFEEHLCVYDKSLKTLTLNKTFLIEDGKIVIKNIANEIDSEIGELNSFTDPLNAIQNDNLSIALQKAYFELNKLANSVTNDFFTITGGNALIHILVPLFEKGTDEILCAILNQIKELGDAGVLSGVDVKVIAFGHRLYLNHEDKNTPDIIRKHQKQSYAFLERINQSSAVQDQFSNFFILDNVNRNTLNIDFNYNYIAKALNELFSATMLHDGNVLINDGSKFGAFGIGIINFDDLLVRKYTINRLMIDGYYKEGIDINSESEVDTDYLISKTNKFLEENIDIFDETVLELIKSSKGPSFEEIIGKNKTEDISRSSLIRLSEKFEDETIAPVLACANKVTKDKTQALNNKFYNFDDRKNTDYAFNKAFIANLIGENDEALKGVSLASKRLNIDYIENGVVDQLQKFIPSDKKVDIRRLQILKSKIANSTIYLKELEKNLYILEESLDELDRIKEIKFDNGIFSNDGVTINANGYVPSIGSDLDAYVPSEEVLLSKYIDLRSYFPKVEDQKNTPSCTAFAVGATYEYLAKRNNANNAMVSKLFIYYQARSAQGNQNDPHSGSSIYDAIIKLKEEGTCLAQTWPFLDNNVNVKPNEEAYSEAKQFILHEAQSVNICEDIFKSALSDGFPIIVGIKTYRSFMLGHGNGMIPYPTAADIAEGNNGEHGNHAMTIVGYSDADKYFIVRNSWGANFGDKGYCYIPYDYIANPKFCHNAFIVKSIVDLVVDDVTPLKQTDGLLFAEQSNIVRHNIARYTLQCAKREHYSLEREFKSIEIQYFKLIEELKSPKYWIDSKNTIVEDINSKREQFLNTYNACIEDNKSGCLGGMFGKKKIKENKNEYAKTLYANISKIEEELLLFLVKLKVGKQIFEDILQNKIDLTNYYIEIKSFLKELGKWNSHYCSQINDSDFENPVFIIGLINREILKNHYENNCTTYLSKWPSLYSLFKEKYFGEPDFKKSKEKLDAYREIRECLGEYLNNVTTEYNDFDIQQYLLGLKTYSYLPAPLSFEKYINKLQIISEPFLQVAPGEVGAPSINKCMLRQVPLGKTFDSEIGNTFVANKPSMIDTFANKKVAFLQMESGIEVTDTLEFILGKKVSEI